MKCIESYRTTVVYAAGLQTKQSRGVPFMRQIKLGALDECVGSFLGEVLGSCSKAR